MCAKSGRAAVMLVICAAALVAQLSSHRWLQVSSQNMDHSVTSVTRVTLQSLLVIEKVPSEGS